MTDSNSWTLVMTQDKVDNIGKAWESLQTGTRLEMLVKMCTTGSLDTAMTPRFDDRRLTRACAKLKLSLPTSSSHPIWVAITPSYCKGGLTLPNPPFTSQIYPR